MSEEPIYHKLVVSPIQYRWIEKIDYKDWFKILIMKMDQED